MILNLLLQLGVYEGGEAGITSLFLILVALLIFAIVYVPIAFLARKPPIPKDLDQLSVFGLIAGGVPSMLFLVLTWEWGLQQDALGS